MSADAVTGDDPLPLRVRQSLRFFRRHPIWYLTSTNPPVGSCAQAAQRRKRLGSTGIPLCDELKSLLYRYEGRGGCRAYVLLHCRGHQRIDLKKVSLLIRAQVTPVLVDELRERFGAVYGTVTPLLFDTDPEVQHVVDDTILARFYSPHTMMTNCGDLEYAVEFRPADMFRVMPRTVVADIVQDSDKRVPRHAFGILTGNSAESGILLWEKINKAIRTDARVRFRGDDGLPRVLVDSVPEMGASMELPDRASEVRKTVLSAVDGLCRAGATVIGVACNTTQYFEQDIAATCSDHGARFISIAEETASVLRRTATGRFDLLGIRPVTDLDGWSDFGRTLRGLDVTVPTARQVEAITELAFQVKSEVVTAATVNRLRDLINRSTQTDTVVLALTELSVVFAQQKRLPPSGKRFIDTLDVLAASMAKIYLEERIATGGA